MLRLLREDTELFNVRAPCELKQEQGNRRNWSSTANRCVWLCTVKKLACLVHITAFVVTKAVRASPFLSPPLSLNDYVSQSIHR